MRVLTVIAGLLWFAGLIWAQCPTSEPWRLISGRCMMCGVIPKDIEGASAYCKEHGGTLGPILDGDQEEFAESCTTAFAATGLVLTGLRARNGGSTPIHYWDSGTPHPPVTPFITLTQSDSVNAGCYAISATNTWDMVAATCQGPNLFVCTRAPVTCENILPPPNTQVNYASATTPHYVDTVATYSCSEGYVRSGDSSTRTCLSDGMWSPEELKCVPVDCGPLAAPPHGTVAADTTTYNTVATYSCALGFAIAGSSPTRICLADQTWSGTDLQCTVVDCGDLPDPANGAVTAQTTFFGSVAIYSCNEDYKLDGALERTCLATAFWVPEAPTCVAEDSDTLAIALGSTLGGLTLLGIIATLVVLCCRRDPSNHWHPAPYRRRSAPRPQPRARLAPGRIL